MRSASVQLQPESLLRHLLEGTSSKTGEEFFQALVRAAAQALGVKGVWVTEYLPEQRVLRSLSFWMNGDFIKDFEYKIDGTPCELVVEQARVVHYPERIIELFPNDPDLVALNAVSFVGAPFMKPDGTVLGHLAAVDTKPLKLDSELESAFKIFAARAGAEFNRIRAEAKIRESEQRFSGLFESAMDAILELDEDFSIQRANGSAAALFTSPGESVANRKMTEFLCAASAEKLATVVRELNSESQSYAWVPGGFEAKKADGSCFAAEASVSQFEVQGKRRYSLILRNVQDQLVAESRLRELQEEAAYLWSEINELQYGGEILGNSPAIRDLITAIHQVAPTPATVFVSGETGTGKELVARAIHHASNRAGKPFIRVNCAAIPAALCESEFFGHERGAFTGAATRRTGRFELANGGTIFLDEVGEMPLELQPKLLRVLQEGEFEPVGSSQTRKVDVRVIAATNRDLSEEVAAGRFREDLFYRLHVFPISAPPLRDRGSDVELLADHLLKCNCKRMGRAPLELTADCLRRLRSYHWPGNVRELENVIERAVIIARDGRLNLRDVLPLDNLLAVRGGKSSGVGLTLQTKDDLREAERTTLLRALEEAHWKVSGPRGAARKLGIPPSTLSSRMKVLRIQRPQ
ncbi:MAG TPA: sigma 54-interacting transcriptional regulator [Candidatus Dormibacteraeota bacterium]|jgi:PAS domain S-box-containing protein|nr:sigma 54-interacting transcriptional regulator [Candidatus Dormibacteraeota bacterium]